MFTRAAIMGSHNWSTVLQGRGEPTRIWFSGVTAGFFDTLGVRPILGRGFRPEDDVPNAPGIAVLNHSTWVRRFGSDPNVIGTRMLLDGNAVEIVGVMPPRVDFPRGAEFWVPIVPLIASGTPPNTANLETFGVFYVVGRVRAGLTPPTLRDEINATEANLDRAVPGRLKWGTAAVVTTFVDYVFGPVRPALRVLWAAVAVLLLIACANISGLMLTRVSRQQHDHSIRLALGAGRFAIGRSWMIEMLVVAMTGGVFGVAVAYWIAKAIRVLAPDDLPGLAEIGVSAPVALFTFLAVIAVALLTVLVPLRHASQATLTDALEGERTTTGRGALRARSTLLVAQIGLSIVLLIAAGLVVRSFQALRQVDLGFAPSNVLSVTVQPQESKVPPNVWLDRFLDRVRSLPGVEAAGAVYLRPLMLGPIGQGVGVRLEGQPETREATAANPVLNHQIATPGYFEAMRISLRAGRRFTAQDTKDTPRVAIVSESTAKRLWPGQDPIGKRISMSSFTPGGPRTMWRTIVGVVSDVRYRSIEEVQLDVYDAALQTGRPADNVVIRTTRTTRAAGGALGLAPGVRAVARELDPSAIVDNVTTLDDVVARAEAPWRLTMWMFVLFAALAFGLAALGLFSLVAIDIGHRAREFAIRMALGASRPDILRSVLARAGRRVALGVVLGLAAAVAASRAMGGLLFAIGPDDAQTYVGVLALVVIVVTLAAYLPARHAGRVDPQVLLRRP
jgi:predicted permease